MQTEQVIRRLYHREQICTLRSRYAWYLDNGDWEEWAGLFSADATLDYDGMDPIEGRDAIRSFATEALPALYTYSMHTVQSPRLSVDDEEAVGHWYLLVFYEKPEGASGWVAGTYRDEYRLIDGEWLFSRVENEVEYDSAPESPHL
jgi:hypothetical protein